MRLNEERKGREGRGRATLARCGQGGLCLSWKKMKAGKLGNKVRQALTCRAADHRQALPAGNKISQLCEGSHQGSHYHVIIFWEEVTG